jgi:hypothetical protein
MVRTQTGIATCKGCKCAWLGVCQHVKVFAHLEAMMFGFAFLGRSFDFT